MAEVPTLYEWMGGMEKLAAWVAAFYARVPSDLLLEPLFSRMSPQHAEHVTHFIAEVLGGPPRYSAEHGGHPNMIRHHVGKGITEAQRQRWMQLLLESADDCGLPDDPEFRSALVSYLEWGTRLAVINSKPGAGVTGDAPMPNWGWGVVKGPYLP